MATSDNYVSSAKFADIVDDCLWYTFEYLSVKEKVGVMRVNKRWRKVTTDLIENENCLKLNLMKKETETITNNRMYTDEESVKQNLIAIFGNEASLFSYKLEFVEQIRIIGHEGSPNLSDDTGAYYTRCKARKNPPIFNNRPLTLTDIVWLFKRFPKLTSLNLAHVEIFNPMVSKSKKARLLKDIPSRLKSLRLSSSDYFWVDSLIEKDNVLEELRLKTKTFEWRKPANLPFLRVVSLNTSVPQLFNLIANSPDISEIRLRGLQPDCERGVGSYSLKPFMQLAQLKTLALSYDHRFFLVQEERSLGDGEEKSLKQYLLDLETDSLQFSNLRLFKLSNVFIKPEIFGDILSKMPTTKCLKLRNIYVECHHYAPCLSCPNELVEHLPTLQNLVELHLNNNSDNDCNECLIASLAQLISDERLPKLRKFKCCLKDLFSPFLYEAFTNLAWKHPRESFAMMTPFDDQPNNAELLAAKPRNLEAIHSRCTSKDVSRSILILSYC